MAMRIVVLTALESELEGVHLPVPVYYTGVGKVNAAYTTLDVIRRHAPDIVINFGTAGAINPDVSGLVVCGAAVERDMDLSGLGLPLGHTFGDAPDMTHIRWDAGPLIGTGDQFVQAPPMIECDLVDMEAYAIARVCRLENIPFRAVKYISDTADAEAADNWHANKAKGGVQFHDWLLREYRAHIEDREPATTK